MKIEIKHWCTGGVLFEHDAEKNTIKLTVEAAVKARARLDGARLVGASLDGASLDGASLDGARLDGASLVGARLDGASLVGARLDGASLDGASLVGASLVGASLVGASLVGARLDGASLVGARLDGARLDGARLDGASLVGARLDGASLDDGSKISKCERPIFQLGGLGSAARYFVAHLTDKGIRLRTGCFFGSVADFRAKLKIRHKDNTHAIEYEAAITLIEAHFKLWPKVK
jgi:hypothetical protein